MRRWKELTIEIRDTIFIPGESYISASGYFIGDSESGNLRFELEFLDNGNSVISTHVGNTVNPSNGQRLLSKVENILVPSNAVKIRGYGADLSGTGNPGAERWMLNAGSIALPYRDPVFQFNRDLVTSKVIASDAIRARHIAAGEIEADHIDANSIETRHLTADLIEAEHIQADAIETRHLQAEIVESEHIAADAIEAGHIQANAIQTKHLEAGAVRSEHIEADTIEAEHIQAEAIEADHIGANQIEARHIAAGTIEADHIAANAIEARHIEADSIDADHIQSGAIETHHLTANLIEADHIQADAIEADHIDANAIEARHISTDAIQSRHIDAEQIEVTHLVGQTITSAWLYSGDVEADRIQAGNIASDAIQSRHIHAGTITSGHLEATTLSGIFADLGSITAGQLRGEDGKFLIDLGGGILRIQDNQAVAQTRVEIGRLGGGDSQWGIRVRDDLGKVILDATGLGVDTVSTAQILGGSVTQDKVAGNLYIPEIVSSLPNLPHIDYPAGSLVSLTTDGKLYRSLGGEWTAAVAPTDLSGPIPGNLLEDGAIDVAKFAQGIRPIEIVETTPLPAAGNEGRVIYYAHEGKLYRDTGSEWTAEVPVEDLSGTITANMVQAGLIAAGAIGADQIAANAISTEHLRIGSHANLINNPSVTGTLDGWDDTNVTLGSAVRDGVNVITMVDPGEGAPNYSDWFEVDPNKTYEIKASFLTESSLYAHWLGFEAQDEFGQIVPVLRFMNFPVMDIGRRYTDTTSTPQFFTFGSINGRWFDLTAYILGHSVPEEAVPMGQNAESHYRMPPSVRRIRLLWANNSRNRDVHLWSPTVTPVDATVIHGDTIMTGTVQARHIEVGSLTADRLYSGTVEADKIQAANIATGAIVADHIGANQINANHIAAGTITASKLSITDWTNLVSNPSFATGDLSEWRGDASGEWRVVSSDDPEVPSNAPTDYVAAIDVTTANRVIYPNDQKLIDVVPGETYHFSALTASTPGAPTDSARFWVVFWRRDGSSNSRTIWAEPTDGAWGEVSGTVEVPPNCIRMRIALRVEGQTNPQGTWYFTGVRVRKSVGSVLIEDGAIHAQHIGVGQIVADHIESNSITLNELNFTPAHAGNIVGMINASSEDGSIRISGSRLHIDSSVTFESGYNPLHVAQASLDKDTYLTPGTTTIAGGEITSGTITANKLTITEFSNLVANPNFRTGDLQDWDHGGAVIVQSALDPGVPPLAPSSHVAEIPLASGGYVSSRRIEVVPGEKYYASVWATDRTVLEDGDELFRFRAKEPTDLTTDRDTPATYRDRTGTLRTAAPGVLRTTWQDGRPYALVEPSGENLIPLNRRKFEGWTKHQGAEVTVTQGYTIPGYSPEGEATRIQTAGGSHPQKYYAASMGTRDGGAESQSIVIQNIGTVAVRITTNAGPPHATVQPGETRLVRTSSETTASGSSRQMQFRAPTADDDLDFLAYAPQIETSPVATSYIPEATRGRDLISVGYPHGVHSLAVYEAGIEAGLSATTNGHAWQIGGGSSTSTRALQVRARGSTGHILLRLGNGTGYVDSLVPLVPMGAEYLRLALLDVQGTQARVRLLQRHRAPGGAWLDLDGGWSAWLDVSELLAMGWESPHLTIGNVREGTQAGRLMLSEFRVLEGSGWDLEQLPPPASMDLVFYDANGTAIPESYAIPPTFGRWEQFETQVEVPENAVTMEYRLRAERNVVSNESWYFTGARLRKTAGSVHIEDGAITADHIQAGSITTEKLAFAAVGSDNIIASINASEEGLRISGNKIHIDGTVTFAANMSPDDVRSDAAQYADSQADAARVAAIQAAASDASSKATAAEQAARAASLARSEYLTPGTTTIDGGKITANSIEADQIGANVIGARHIAARAITTDKLLIGSLDNLAVNGGFESGEIHPHAPNNQGSWSITSNRFHGGMYSALFDPSGQSGTATLTINGSSSWSARDLHVQAQPGEEYYGEMWVRKDTSSDSNRVRLRLQYVGEDGSNSGSISSSTVTPTTSWQKVTVTGTVPDYAVIVRLRIDILNDGHNGNPLYFDDIFFRRRISGELVVDGSITTSHLNFTPTDSGNIVGRINASTEGIEIHGDKIQIDGTTVFSSGYNPREALKSSAHVIVGQPNINNASGHGNPYGMVIETDGPAHLGYATVHAGSSGTFTVELRERPGTAAGTVVDETEVTVPSGRSRIELDLYIPHAGRWWLGIPHSHIQLHRETNINDFPYDEGTVRIVGGQPGGSGALTNAWYYFYDLEVAAQGIRGAPFGLITEGTTTIDGGKITTGSITTRQLFVGSFDNLIQNPSFDAGSDLFPHEVQNDGGGNWVVSSQDPRTGPRHLAFAPGNSQTATARLDLNGLSQDPSNGHPRCSEGDAFYAAVRVKKRSSGPANNAVISIHWRNATGGLVDSSYSILEPPSAGSYALLEVSGTAPPGAAYAALTLQVHADGYNNVIDFDDVYFRRMVDGELVVDGAITANHISVDTLDAVSADLGTITAGRLRNPANTAGIRLNGDYSRPGSWDRYIDFMGSGTDPFIKHEALILTHGGDAVFSGEVASDRFTAELSKFNSIIVGGDPALDQNYYQVSLGASGQVDMDFYSSADIMQFIASPHATQSRFFFNRPVLAPTFYKQDHL